MDQPFIDTELLKLSFSWVLCIKQLLIILAVAFLVFMFNQFLQEKARTEQTKDEMINTLIHEEYRLRDLLESVPSQATTDGDEERRERIRKERAHERNRRIDIALSSRSESTKIKKCRSCGGVFGTGSTCQFCGQP